MFEAFVRRMGSLLVHIQVRLPIDINKCNIGMKVHAAAHTYAHTPQHTCLWVLSLSLSLYYQILNVLASIFVCRQLFLCVAVGLWAGLIIGFVTEYYTSNAYR